MKEEERKKERKKKKKKKKKTELIPTRGNVCMYEKDSAEQGSRKKLERIQLNGQMELAVIRVISISQPMQISFS